MAATPEQRARRAAQRANARRVHARGGYKPVLRQQTARARTVRQEYVQQFNGGQKSPGDYLDRLRSQVRKHKRDAFGDDIKWRGKGSDDAVHKYPAPRANYEAVLRADREDLRDLAKRGKYEDDWKFLFYH